MSANDYPPHDHLIRALRIRVTREGGHVAPIVPEARVANAVLPEFFAMLVDLEGGRVAHQAVRPDQTATRALTLHVLNSGSGQAHAMGRLLRSGRTGVEVEVRVVDAAGATLAHADVSYARLTVDADAVDREADGSGERDFALSGAELGQPLRSYLGIRRSAEGACCDIRSRSSNSMRSLHGGAQASLIAAAAEWAEESGAACFTRDLQIRFLSHARKGPVEAESSVLGCHASGYLVRVQTFDRGDGDRPVAVATARVEPA